MSTVTSKGQVTIPKAIRDELGIRPGDEIVFEETEDGYAIRKAVDPDRFERWRGAIDTDQTVAEYMTEIRGGR